MTLYFIPYKHFIPCDKDIFLLIDEIKGIFQTHLINNRCGVFLRVWITIHHWS